MQNKQRFFVTCARYKIHDTRSFIVLLDTRKFGLCVAKNIIHTYARVRTESWKSGKVMENEILISRSGKVLENSILAMKVWKSP